MCIGILRVQCNMHGGFCTHLPIVKLCYHTVHLHRYIFSDDDVVCLQLFRFVNCYSSLKPYFAADPLLLCDFVYLCPEVDYLELFKIAPAHVSLVWLSSYLPFSLGHTNVRCLARVKCI